MNGKRWLFVALPRRSPARSLLGAASAAPPPDHALLALNILPPGEASNGADLTSQLPLYDGLTPLRGNVTTADVKRLYKPETLGLGGAKPTRVERPKNGVTIDRDSFDVPHIYGTTRANTEFGAGWATAEDRGIDLQLLRGPARISALDVPGYDAFSVALSGKQFIPSAQTETFLAAQVPLAQKTAKGRQLIRDVDAYLARDQRVLQGAGRVREAVHAERRRRDRDADRRGVRRGRRQRGEAARCSSARCSSGSARRRGSRSGTTCASRAIRRRR